MNTEQEFYQCVFETDKKCDQPASLRDVGVDDVSDTTIPSCEFHNGDYVFIKDMDTFLLGMDTLMNFKAGSGTFREVFQYFGVMEGQSISLVIKSDDFLFEFTEDMKEALEDQEFQPDRVIEFTRLNTGYVMKK